MPSYMPLTSYALELINLLNSKDETGEQTKINNTEIIETE